MNSDEHDWDALLDIYDKNFYFLDSIWKLIHNLMNLSTIKDIEDFVNRTLLKSLTFTLETQIIKKLNINIYIQDINQYQRILSR